MIRQFTLREIPRFTDPLYLDWVRGLPCCVCGKSPVEPHHEGPKGMGQKCSDYQVVPLCIAHHQERHFIGAKTFWAQIDYKDVMVSCLANYLGRMET